MAIWTTPKTWNVGDVLTAADMNTYVRDNTSYLHDPIVDYTVTGSAVATIDTNTLLGGNIPATYSHLRMLLLLRETGVTTRDTFALQFNGDTGANYENQLITGLGSSPGAAGGVSQTSAIAGGIAGSTATASRFSQTVVDLLEYKGTTKHKTYSSFSSLMAGGGTNTILYSTGGLWANTAAITRIVVIPGTGNVDLGSRLVLYGVP